MHSMMKGSPPSTAIAMKASVQLCCPGPGPRRHSLAVPLAPGSGRQRRPCAAPAGDRTAGPTRAPRVAWLQSSSGEEKAVWAPSEHHWQQGLGIPDVRMGSRPGSRTVLEKVGGWVGGERTKLAISEST
jgi:hypothetical protein